MNVNVAIVDYGIGNVLSVQRALEYSGARRVVLTNKSEELLQADKIILPGVGAFADGISGLQEHQLIEPLLSVANEGKHVLGICLGMQLLASESGEFGCHKGLNLIPGKVARIVSDIEEFSDLKVPFVGWSPVSIAEAWSAKSHILSALKRHSVYLVHSYHLLPDRCTDRLASYDYAGHSVTAAVKRENITGLQFHPEKSGPVGLNIIKNFLKE